MSLRIYDAYVTYDVCEKAKSILKKEAGAIKVNFDGIEYKCIVKNLIDAIKYCHNHSARDNFTKRCFIILECSDQSLETIKEAIMDNAAKLMGINKCQIL